MGEVSGHFNNNDKLSCTAKEVFANNATVLHGPSECSYGEVITVNLTASIHFNTDRKDIGVYTATSTSGCDISIEGNNCAVNGTACAVDILDKGDSDISDGHVLQDDSKPSNYQDMCYDVRAPQGGWDLNNFLFQENLEIPCIG
jgi:hypothetical protein